MVLCYRPGCTVAGTTTSGKMPTDHDPDINDAHSIFTSTLAHAQARFGHIRAA